MAERGEHIGGVLPINVACIQGQNCQCQSPVRIKHTCRIVVADREPGIHVVVHCACLAELSCTANLLGTSPDHRSVVAPALEVRHIRLLVAVVRAGIQRYLAVPLILERISQCLFGGDALSVGRAICGNVLAVISGSDRPVSLVSASLAPSQILEQGGNGRTRHA